MQLADQIEIVYCSADGFYQATLYWQGVATQGIWALSCARAVLSAVEKVQTRNPSLTFPLLGQLPVVVLP